jgi:formate dehydrogenase iron-sulfur subunit
MALQSLDIERRSATTTPPPGAREQPQVAKLLDVSRCIGCKACQVACQEWNDLRSEIGHNVGVIDNPLDLDEHSWTVMRYAEVEPEGGNLEWLIRKDGCMHCADPGCLKACPAPGAIVQYSNGIVDFHQEHCIGCGYCVAGCPFDIPRISKKDNKAYKCTLCSDRVAVGLEPACVKSCPTGSIMFGTKEDMIHQAEGRVAELQERGFANAGRRWYSRHVRAAARRQPRGLQWPAEGPDDRRERGRVEGPDEAGRARPARPHRARRLHPLPEGRAQGGRARSRRRQRARPARGGLSHEPAIHDRPLYVG